MTFLHSLCNRALCLYMTFAFRTQPQNINLWVRFFFQILMTSFVFPHNAQWETVHTENKTRRLSLPWKTESPLISQRKFPHKIGNGSMSTGSATLKRLRCEVLATPGGNKCQLQPTTSRICGKMNENVPASSFIYLQIFRNIYILIKTSVHRCSSSNRKHPLISLVMFIVFVFPLPLIKWTSFDHKMAQKPQPQVL